jgi:hypothetical protein
MKSSRANSTLASPVSCDWSIAPLQTIRDQANSAAPDPASLNSPDRLIFAVQLALDLSVAEPLQIATNTVLQCLLKKQTAFVFSNCPSGEHMTRRATSTVDQSKVLPSMVEMSATLCFRKGSLASLESFVSRLYSGGCRAVLSEAQRVLAHPL